MLLGKASNYLSSCTVTHQIYGCNLAVGKGDEHKKLCPCSLTQKFIRYNNFKVVIRRKKQSMKACVSWTRRNNLREREREREREQTRNFNFLSGFLVSVLTCLFAGFSPQLCVWCETPFRSLPKHGARTFRLSLHFSGWCSTLVFTLWRLRANKL